MDKLSRVIKLLTERERIPLYLSLFTAFIFCLFYFNVGMNAGGDDSGYVLRAMRFWERGEFPKFQGAVYPAFLAPFYGLSNGNLLVLRMISIPMFLGSLYYIFNTFKTSIQPLAFLLLLLTLSINYYWLTYSSLTYSEALFNLIQFGIFYFFYHRFIRGSASIRDLFILSFLGLILLKTRAIGAVFFVTVFIYFLIHRQWKNLKIFSFISLLLVLLWDGLTHFVLSDSGSVVLSQMMGLLRENPYDASLGMADISLVFQRLFYNFNEYISKHILQMLAIRGRGTIEANWFYSILTIAIVLVAILLNKSRKKIISFSLIYLGIGMFIVFMTPKMWSQARFIQPFIPIVYIVLIYELQSITNKKWTWLSGLVISMLFVLQVFHAFQYQKDNRQVIEAYRLGDKYFGHTPDWKNYFTACEWIGDNIGENGGKIACRKPQIATVISKKDIFHGIYNVPDYKCSGLTNELLDEDENYIAINIVSFFQDPVPEEISEALVRGFSGNILDKDKQTDFRLFNIDEEDLYRKIIMEDDQGSNILPIQSLVSRENEYYLSSPDSLVKILTNNNVEYILLGNLRVYKEKRTEEVFSSVHNFMISIKIKYPEMFEQIYQTGLESREPATIYKINYPGKTRRVPVETFDEAPTPTENLRSMLEWAVKNSSNSEYILYGGNGLEFNIDAPDRLLTATSLPTMNYNDFIEVFELNNQKYIIIDPAVFDPAAIDNDLSSEILKSFQGFVYIRDYTLRLHILESPAVFKRIVSDNHVASCMVRYEDILNINEEEKRSFRVVEPTYMMTELQRRNIKYIVEDNLSANLNQNMPKRFLFLIRRRYPGAFFKVQEQGSTDSDRVSVYQINYKVLK